MKKITCLEAVKRMFELTGGQLSPAKKKELDEHIKTCRECCDRLEFEKLLKEKLRKSDQEKKLPATFKKRIDKLLKNFSHGTF